MEQEMKQREQEINALKEERRLLEEYPLQPYQNVTSSIDLKLTGRCLILDVLTSYTPP